MLKNIILITMLYFSLFADDLKDTYTIIDDDLQSSLRLYEIQNISSAIEGVKFARHHGYKNTGLEKNIINNISQEYSASIDKHFEKIIALMQKQRGKKEIESEIKIVLKEVQVALPQLKNIKTITMEKDWAKVTDEVIANLTQANLLYKDGDTKKSIDKVQETYFDVFEQSGFEKAILDMSIDRKVKAEEHFRLISNMIKAGNSFSDIEYLIDDTKDDLLELSELLKPQSNKQDDSSLVFVLPLLLFASTLGIYAIKRKR